MWGQIYYGRTADMNPAQENEFSVLIPSPGRSTAGVGRAEAGEGNLWHRVLEVFVNPAREEV